MCRFLGYIGSQPILLKGLLDHYANSLVIQSRRARETKTGLNADGFGVGWYDRSITDIPGVFKSTQPAWNDNNLRSLSNTVCSNCFIGHVRASTVGDVSLANCHPFLFEHRLSAHNGTIVSFRSIQRDICNLLHEADYRLLRGQTDSEHFMALVSTFLREREDHDVNTYEAAIRRAVIEVHRLQEYRGVPSIIRANILFTDGIEFVALKYSSDPERDPWSFYFAPVELQERTALPVFKNNVNKPSGIVMASEVLTDSTDAWQEVPFNSFLRIDKELNVTMNAF